MISRYCTRSCTETSAASLASCERRKLLNPRASSSLCAGPPVTGTDHRDTINVLTGSREGKVDLLATRCTVGSASKAGGRQLRDLTTIAIHAEQTWSIRAFRRGGE